MKPFSCLTFRAGLLLSSLLVLYSAPSLAVDGKHVNAYVVTTQWRSGGLNWGPACPDCWSGWAGNIELVTVTNGAVSKVDTIWNRTQGYGQYPAFDAEAKRIAFYRWAQGTSGNTTVTRNNGVNTVSIINRNGSNVQNLVTLRDAPFGEMALNWPVGNWVYYINPQQGTSQSNEIRRVNVTTLADELVYSAPGQGHWFRRFETSMDGVYVGLQTYGGTATINGVYKLTSSIPLVAYFEGCNASVSASGNYGSNYFAGNHTEICLSKVNIPGTGSSSMPWVPLWDKGPDYSWPVYGNVNQFLGASGTAGFNCALIDESRSCECMRWAANSDKWVLQMVNMYGLGNEVNDGANCVAVNFVDKTAFWVSRNEKLPIDNETGIIYHGNSTGDMWIDGGAATLGKWEDTTGVWHAVPGFVPTGVSELGRISNDRPAASIAGIGSGIRITLPAGRTFMVRVIDAQGRTVIQKRVTGEAVLHDQRLHAGVYQVIMEYGGEMYGSTLTLAQ